MLTAAKEKDEHLEKTTSGSGKLGRKLLQKCRREAEDVGLTMQIPRTIERVSLEKAISSYCAVDTVDTLGGAWLEHCDVTIP